MTGVEQLLIAWLTPLLPGTRISTDIPIDLAAELPMIRVYRVGGARTFSLDKPSVDLDVFAGSRLAATNLAQQVDDLLNYNLPTTVLDCVLGLDGTYSGPSFRNYDNPAVYRMGAAYGLLVHKAYAPAR